MRTTKELSKRWIGIDGGGTKTSCVIGDEHGHLLASAVGSASNIQGVSLDKVRSTLLALIDKVIIDSKSTLQQVESIYLCLAGADRESDRVVIRGLFQKTDYESKIQITNDAKAAFVAGTWGETGLLLIAGTGSIVFAQSKETDQVIRVGGWGYLLGDEGSGFYIGKHALNAVLKSFDKREQETLLTELLLNHFQITDARELISIYSDELLIPKIANLSKYVIEAAKKEDAIAKSILFDSVNELIEMVLAANRQLVEPSKLLVLHGGMFADSYFKELFVNGLSTRINNITIVQSELPAVVGAYLLALIDDGRRISSDIKGNVYKTWNQLQHYLIEELK